jgi:hypothetical protein
LKETTTCVKQLKSSTRRLIPGIGAERRRRPVGDRQQIVAKHPAQHAPQAAALD